MRLSAILLMALTLWAADGGQTGQDSDVQIRLTTDKAEYGPGEEIHFLVQAVNRGSEPLRILYDGTFVGRTMECVAENGALCPNEGGYATWSPKVGVFTGRTYLLQPGESQTFNTDALLDDRRQMIFSNSFESRGSGSFLELKRKLNLPLDFPDKYIAAGAIIRLAGPGKYRLAYVYSAEELDKKWRFAGAATPEEASVDRLWLGRAVSNTVDIWIR